MDITEEDYEKFKKIKYKTTVGSTMPSKKRKFNIKKNEKYVWVGAFIGILGWEFGRYLTRLLANLLAP